MLKNIVKILGFAAVILLAGQIPVGSATIASRFQRGVGDAIAWGGRGIAKNRLVAGLSRSVGKSVKPKPQRSGDDDDKDADGTVSDDVDGVSPSDRESLLRLLQ